MAAGGESCAQRTLLPTVDSTMPDKNPPALRAAPFAKGGIFGPPFEKGGQGGFITFSHEVYECFVV